MSTIVLQWEVGGQNWVSFCQRMQLLNAPLDGEICPCAKCADGEECPCGDCSDREILVCVDKSLCEPVCDNGEASLPSGGEFIK